MAGFWRCLIQLNAKGSKELTGFSDSKEIIDFANAAAWETWLESHCDQQGGVWLRIAKKDSGKTSITISEALDVALCYGWIENNRLGYDETYYLQRYSRRRSKSPWSKLNVERAEALMVAGRMHPRGLLEIEAAKNDGRWIDAYEPRRESVHSGQIFMTCRRPITFPM